MVSVVRSFHSRSTRHLSARVLSNIVLILQMLSDVVEDTIIDDTISTSSFNSIDVAAHAVRKACHYADHLNSCMHLQANPSSLSSALHDCCSYGVLLQRAAALQCSCAVVSVCVTILYSTATPCTPRKLFCTAFSSSTLL
eukprot:17925-Heterococcus_DN1.PRE.2